MACNSKINPFFQAIKMPRTPVLGDGCLFLAANGIAVVVAIAVQVGDSNYQVIEISPLCRSPFRHIESDWLHIVEPFSFLQIRSCKLLNSAQFAHVLSSTSAFAGLAVPLNNQNFSLTPAQDTSDSDYANCHYINVGVKISKLQTTISLLHDRVAELEKTESETRRALDEANTKIQNLVTFIEWNYTGNWKTNTPAADDGPRFPFLSLPRELRDVIYQMTFTFPNHEEEWYVNFATREFINGWGTCGFPCGCPCQLQPKIFFALLSSNRQIYEEAKGVFYSHAHFRFHNHLDLFMFLRGIGAGRRRYIGKITIDLPFFSPAASTYWERDAWYLTMMLLAQSEHLHCLSLNIDDFDLPEYDAIQQNPNRTLARVPGLWILLFFRGIKTITFARHQTHPKIKEWLVRQMTKPNPHHPFQKLLMDKVRRVLIARNARNRPEDEPVYFDFWSESYRLAFATTFNNIIHSNEQ